MLRACPGAQVVALTSFTDEELVERDAARGRDRLPMKNVTADQLADAIRAAHAGRSTLAPEAADVLVKAISAPAEIASRSRTASARSSR